MLLENRPCPLRQTRKPLDRADPADELREYRSASTERMCTVICASVGPALLPSYAVNAIGAPTPTTRASASATGVPIPISFHVPICV